MAGLAGIPVAYMLWRRQLVAGASTPAVAAPRAVRQPA
jgi:hypothetical protein